MWGETATTTNEIVKKLETITVSSTNHVVKKLTWNIWTGLVEGYAKDGTMVPFSAHLDIEYKDRNQNIIHTSSCDFSNGTRYWEASQSFDSVSSPFGFFVKISNIALSKGNLINPPGDSWYQNAYTIHSDYDSGIYDVQTYMGGCFWNDSQHCFQYISFGFNSTQYGKNLIHDYYYIKKPGEEEKKIDSNMWNSSIWGMKRELLYWKSSIPSNG